MSQRNLELRFAPGQEISAQRRLDVVDALRGIAALSVAWHHFTGVLPGGWLKVTGIYGWLGVEIFFVISGFVIPLSMYRGGYRLRAHFGTFMLKRIVRLEPPYLVAIVLILVLWFLSSLRPEFKGSHPDISFMQFIVHLGYLNAFVGYPWLNDVFWSLAVEFQFYLIAALSFPVLVHQSSMVRIGALIVFCLAGMQLSDPAHVFRYAPLFALGIVTFWKLVGITSQRSFFWLVLAIALAGVYGIGFSMILVGVLTAIVITFVRWAGGKVLAFLGTVSFSLYLVHTPIGGRVMTLGMRFGDSLGLQVAVLAAAVAASLVAAYAMYVLIEKPAKRWSQSLTYQR